MLKFIKNWLRSEKDSTIDDPMKFLIVGLGNVGPKYTDTRHNVGFSVVEALADKFSSEFDSVSHGYMARFRHKGRTFLLLKPDTFMNLSGKAVRYWMQKEKIQPNKLLVVVDDINLPLGKLRLRSRGSDGGHNGLKSIQELLGHNNYPRLRIGIGDDFSRGKQVDFVLGKWTPKEREQLESSIDRAIDGVLKFGTIGLGRTMNTING